MKTKILTALITLFISSTVFSQQISDGMATQITNFNVALGSGAYNGYNPTGALSSTQPEWQHLLVVRHPNPLNNYQLQITSTISENDRLFFRKLASGTATAINSTWNELATRGSNNFTGDQAINGGISSSISSGTGGYLSLVNASKTSPATALRWTIYNMTGPYGNSLQFWAYDNLSCNGGMCNNRFTIMDNGNVGIGTANPTSKLTVAGNINSREVKVTVDAGADFVFENNYNLPSLDAVERYIKENKHLPEIASADEMKKEGINLSEMNIKLLQKMEEMTLYMIEMKKENESLKSNQRNLEERMKKVEKR